jgi:hypothetical protein
MILSSQQVRLVGSLSWLFHRFLYYFLCCWLFKNCRFVAGVLKSCCSAVDSLSLVLLLVWWWWGGLVHNRFTHRQTQSGAGGCSRLLQHGGCSRTAGKTAVCNCVLSRVQQSGGRRGGGGTATPGCFAIRLANLGSSMVTYTQPPSQLIPSP